MVAVCGDVHATPASREPSRPQFTGVLFFRGSFTLMWMTVFIPTAGLLSHYEERDLIANTVQQHPLACV